MGTSSALYTLPPIRPTVESCTLSALSMSGYARGLAGYPFGQVLGSLGSSAMTANSGVIPKNRSSGGSISA